MTTQQPEALRLAEILEGDYCPDWLYECGVDEVSAELRRLHAYCQELESQVILDCMTHVQNPAEIEHVAGDVSKNGAGLNMSSQHARIADLEAQLEAIGAGGVSGPLIGQPQAMPDLSQLTERGAKAWAGVDAQGMREGLTAADMATASAQGFRDGVASVSAGSEPVAWMTRLPSGSEVFARTRDFYPDAAPVYTHPAPPEGMAGWRPTSEMRAVVAVAVTMLYDTHPEDVLRVFDLCELEKISIITMLLGSQQVEDIYRGAWDQLTAAPGPDDGGSNG